MKDEAIRKLNEVLNEEVHKNEALTRELYEKTVKIETLIERSKESNEMLDFLHDDLEETGFMLRYLAGKINTLEQQIDHMHETLGTYPNKTLRSKYDNLIGFTE